MSANKSRSERKEETRQALLAAARRCFDEKGYAETAVGDIAREAGVAHGTFYVHFAGREAIADALLEGFNAELAAKLGPLLATGDAPLEATVRAAARVFLGALEADRALVRFYAARASHGLPAEALATGINPPALEALTGALAARVGARVRARSELAAHALLAAWLRVGLRHALVPGTRRADAEAVLVALTTGAIRALAPDGET